MKISRQSLLVLDFDLESNAHTIRILPNLGSSLSSWSPHTRVSPIWLFSSDKGDSPIHLRDDDIGLGFIANVNPATFVAHFGQDLSSQTEFGNLWVSLGTFNLIVSLKEDNGAAQLEEFCKAHNLAFELWLFDPTGYEHEAKAAAVEEMEFYAPNFEARTIETTKPLVGEIDETEEHFKPLLIELTALMAMAISRSAYHIPCMTEDFYNAAKVATKFITDTPALRRNSEYGEPDKSRVLSGLHNINAGLSRATSQAFSGTSPIAKTECHFWPHSLLGIGTASHALRNIVAYISDIFETYGYTNRIEKLLGEPSHFDKPINKILFSELSDCNALDKLDIDEGDHPSSIIPITYFSGRDGFKNSDFTTSAPLMSIQAGNCYHYSIVTISHEISHRIVSAAIAKTMSTRATPRPTMAAIFKNLKSKQKTYGDFFFDNYMVCLHSIAEQSLSFSGYENKNESPNYVETIILDYSEEFEEHLVHIFDFWFFFNRDVKLYITSVWCSWSVIPNISSRLEEYIVRTLVALASNYVNAQSWLEESRQQMLTVFMALKERASLHLTDEVIAFLSDEAAFEPLAKRVRARQNIIRVFHAIFKSEVLSGMLADEPLSFDRQNISRRGRDVVKPDRNYPFIPGEFTQQKFGNPLRFLNQYTADERADPVKSAWVLYQLAFNLYRKREDV